MEWIDHIANLIIALGVVLGGYQSWRNGRALTVIHKATNSLTDRLVATTADASFAAGVKDQKDRTDAQT